MVGRNILAHPMAKGLEIYTPARSDLELRDKHQVRAYLQALQPDLIIHAAGRVGGIKANVAQPYEFLAENLEVGTNIIDCARTLGITKLLNLGSSCIYPKDRDGQLSEHMILDGRLEPTNEGYAIAKIAALRLCEYASTTGGMQYKTMIPCNLYGPYDKFDLHSAHLIPAIIRKIHEAKTAGAQTVEIWGDGTARREFMYSADLAEAILRGVREFDDVPALMNVGRGADHSVLEYYETVASVIGWSGTFTFDLSKPAGMQRKLVDVSRQTTWGFRPSTSLEDGIRQTYEFFLRNNAS